MNDILGYIFILICMIPAFLFRKKISFLFCPKEVMGMHTKHKIFGAYCILPSVIIVAYSAARIRFFIEKDDYLRQFENYVLVYAIVTLFILLYVFGIITDWFVYHSNKRYKDWRDQIKKTK